MERALTILLNKLFLELKSINSFLANSLNPGLDEATIKNAIPTEGLIFSQELIELYQWKNGTKLGKGLLGTYSFFPASIFMDLEHAINFYHLRAGKDEYWTELMFPIFGSGGDYYLIDLNQNSPTFNMIYYYSPSSIDFDTTITFYDSLLTCFETIYKCYREKAFYISNSGLYSDGEKEVEIAKKLNPKSEFWE